MKLTLVELESIINLYLAFCFFCSSSLHSSHSFLKMHFSSNLIVASLCVIASTFATAAPAKSNHPQTAINSQDDFCLFLPPKPGLIVAENEDNGIPFCIKPDTVPNATTFPEGKKRVNLLTKRHLGNIF